MPTTSDDGDERAGIKLADVLREEQVGHAEALVPGKAAGAPEIDIRIHRAEQIGEHQRQQVRPDAASRARPR